MVYIKLNIHNRHLKQIRGSLFSSRFMTDDEDIFNVYYALRRYLIDKNDWHVRCAHYSCAEHTRRSKRIAQWFEYKISTRGQDLISEVLKGNDDVWDWFGGQRVPNNNGGPG